MPAFAPEVVAAVLRHMNGDHAADSLVIVRAFGPAAAAAASEARMTGLDEHGGDWSYRVAGVEYPVRIPWPAGTISERSEIRREVVALYDAALARAGTAPPPH